VSREQTSDCTVARSQRSLPSRELAIVARHCRQRFRSRAFPTVRGAFAPRPRLEFFLPLPLIAATFLDFERHHAAEPHRAVLGSSLGDEACGRATRSRLVGLFAIFPRADSVGSERSSARRDGALARQYRQQTCSRYAVLACLPDRDWVLTSLKRRPGGLSRL
jgi:hypothetical protein